jgi:hypothetical protein
MAGIMSYHALLFSSAISLYLHQGLTWRGILRNVPTNPVSIFVYLLVAVSLGLIVWGSRKKGPGSSGHQS